MKIVKVKTLSGQVPERKTTEAAGYDIHAYLPDGDLVMVPYQVYMVPTGLFFAPPVGTTILVCSRSGLAAQGVIVVNGPGIVDSDYRNEVKVLLMKVSPGPLTIKSGDRIGQFVFLPTGTVAMDIKFDTVDQLPAAQSNRAGGFGSTGK